MSRDFFSSTYPIMSEVITAHTLTLVSVS